MQTFTEGTTWRFRALHKATHADYLMHKFSVMEQFCHSSPAFQAIFDERTQVTYQRYYFNTKVHEVFKVLANAFYSLDSATGKMVKVVPHNIEYLLTPAAIAYFYMDDGALKWKGHSNAMRICTENFTLIEVAKLQKVLQNNYGIETKLSRKTLKSGVIGHRIEIPEYSSSAFPGVRKQACARLTALKNLRF